MIASLWAVVREKVKSGNRKLKAEIACYLVLVGAALYFLLPVRTQDEGFMLIVVLGIFTYLIFKTLSQADEEEPKEK
jgi:hypothetical protein